MKVLECLFNDSMKNSHKFYRLEQDGKAVTAQWGRIGAAGQSKTTSFDTAADAATWADRQFHSKLAKGYVEKSRITATVGQSRPAFVPEPEAPSKVGVAAQLAEPMDFDNIGSLIVSDEWVIEQKLDGHRLLLQGTGDAVEPLNRNGQPYAAKNLPGNLRTMVLPDGLILDGELLDLGSLEFWAFDFRALDGSLDTMPLTMRRDLLIRAVDTLSLNVHVLPQAVDTRAKQRLVEQAIAHHAEGVVCKKVSAPYRGRRDPAWRKVKFVSSCEAIVVGVRDDGKESVTVALVDADGMLVEVGRASLIGREDVSLGEVVELRYLYATDDNRLFQPVMVRRRTDKQPLECTMSQLRFTSRSILPF